MPGKRLDNPPSPKTLPGTRISANRVPSGRGDRGSRGKPKVQTPTSGDSAAPVLSGWEHNGHVFEKDLVCKCRKTLAQHNKDPWACPLAVSKLETTVEALRKAMSSKIAGLKRDLQALHQPTKKEKTHATTKPTHPPRDPDSRRGVLPPEPGPEDDFPDLLEQDPW